MSKKTKTKSRGTVPQVDPYLEGLMAKLMERLGSLERKMDTVIAHTTVSRPPDRPMQTQQVFSRPNAPLEPKHPSRHDRTMYEAVCADCSDPCEVPFRPSPERAIYCKPCFAKRRAEGRVGPPQGGRPQGSSGPGPQSNPGSRGSAPSAAVMTAPTAKTADQTVSAPKDQRSVKKSKPAVSAKSSKKAKKK